MGNFAIDDKPGGSGEFVGKRQQRVRVDPSNCIEMHADVFPSRRHRLQRISVELSDPFSRFI